MMRRAQSAPAAGWFLAALGAAGLVVFVLHWSACFGGLTDACYAATQSDFTWKASTALWVIAFPTAITGAFVLAPGRPATLIGVALLMLINPLTDHGAFFIPWDVADTLPFTGATIALATIAAGVFLAASSRPAGTPQARATRGRVSSDTASRA